MNERHLTIIEASKIKERITKADDNGWCKISCEDCPLCIKNNNIVCGCVDLMDIHPEEYEKILIKWDEEHLIKTRAQDFFEKFPNAPKGGDDDGTPKICVKYCGYCKECIGDCAECWNAPLEDE